MHQNQLPRHQLLFTDSISAPNSCLVLHSACEPLPSPCPAGSQNNYHVISYPKASAMAVGGSSSLAQCPPCLQASYPDEKRGGIVFGKRKPRRLHSDTIELQRHWEELGHVSWNIAIAGTAAMGSTLPTERPDQPMMCTRAGDCCPSHPDPCIVRSTFLLTFHLPTHHLPH